MNAGELSSHHADPQLGAEGDLQGIRERRNTCFRDWLVDSVSTQISPHRMLKQVASNTSKRLAMASGPFQPQSTLIPVHVCIHCGATSRREAFEGRAITSGIFTCPKCGEDGPLNVEIRPASEAL